MMKFMLACLFVTCVEFISTSEVNTIEDSTDLGRAEQRNMSYIRSNLQCMPLPGTSATIRKWPYKFVPYILDHSYNFKDREAIRSGIDEIEQNTCIDWIEITDPSAFRDYVSIENIPDFTAKFGRRGGRQVLPLEFPHSVDRGRLLHLLLHTLGIMHEHQRPDRDEYITVNWDNIIEERLYSFVKDEEGISDSLGLDYNYRSVMHYTAYTFAKNLSIPVLSPKHCDVLSEDLGDGDTHGYLTKLDIQNINLFYECY